jgi:hypothetical protein
LDVAPAEEPTMPLAARPIEPPSTGTGAGLIALLGAAAGLLIVIGAFMPWAGFSVDGAARIPAKARAVLGATGLGARLPDARIVLGLGAALLIVSLLAWAARGGALLLHAAVLGLATAAVAMSVAIGYLTAGASEGAAALAREVAGGSARAGGRLAQLAAHVHVTKGAGLWVTLAGAALALVAAAIELLSWSRAADQIGPVAGGPAAPGPAGASQ